MTNKIKPFPTRRADRVKTELPVNIDGVHGITRDISTTGVFLEVGSPYAPGSIIEFTVTLSSPTGDLMFSCEGEVLRSEELEEKYGVATKILSMYLSPMLQGNKK